MGIGSTSTSTNTELKSMLEQALGQMRTLGFNPNSLTSSLNGSGNNLSRSLWTIAGEAEEAINGNDQQKAQASINILQGILNMISFGNHQKEAQNEVNKNSQNINKNDAEEQKKANEIKQQIEGFAANLSTNTNNIQDALDKLDAIGNDTQDLEDLKKQIQAQIEIIEANKTKLNDPETRDQALEAISNAALTIDSLVELFGQTILNIQETIETQNTIIAQNIEEATETITESAEKISAGVVDIQKYIQKDTKETAESVKITTKGGTDIPTGNAEVAAGQTANSNMFSALFSGGQGVRLVLDGNQRINAGQTRISGGAANLASALSGIGRMGNDIEDISNFTNSIGSIGDGISSLVGQYESKVQPYISSIGTYNIEAIYQANVELQEQVKNWKSEPIESQDKQKLSGKFTNNDAAQPTLKLRAAFGI